MKVNVYDFDKTIYDGNSTLDFYFYCLNKKPIIIIYLFEQMFFSILISLKIVTKEIGKKHFFSFLKSITIIDDLINEFWEINKNKIKNWYLLQKKENDIIISASPEFLLKPICDKLKVNLIATKVNKKNGVFISKNCYGIEKVKRFKKEYPKYKIKKFYSDSYTDEPLAAIAEESYKVNKKEVMNWNFKNKGFIKRNFANKNFIKFLFIGAINAFNGVLFAFLFSLFIKDTNVSFILGYLISLTISYVLNSKYNFTEKLTLEKYIKFCISYIPNFVIQNIIVIIFFNILELNKLFVFVLSAIIGIPITFLLLKKFTFKNKRSNNEFKI